MANAKDAKTDVYTETLNWMTKIIDENQENTTSTQMTAVGTMSMMRDELADRKKDGEPVPTKDLGHFKQAFKLLMTIADIKETRACCECDGKGCDEDQECASCEGQGTFTDDVDADRVFTVLASL